MPHYYIQYGKWTSIITTIYLNRKILCLNTHRNHNFYHLICLLLVYLVIKSTIYFSSNTLPTYALLTIPLIAFRYSWRDKPIAYRLQIDFFHQRQWNYDLIIHGWTRTGLARANDIFIRWSKLRLITRHGRNRHSWDNVVCSLVKLTVTAQTK